MPIFGFPDRQSYNRMARAVRKVDSLPIRVGEMRVKDRQGANALIGKPATDFSAGALTAPNNVVNLWSGDFGSLAATGATKEVKASLGDFTTANFVIVSRLDGKWVASCAPPGVS